MAKKTITYIKKVNDESDLNEDVLSDIDFCLGYSELEIISTLNSIAYENKYGGGEMASIYPSFDIDGAYAHSMLDKNAHYLAFNAISDLFCKERNAMIIIEVVVEYALAVKLILDWIKHKKIKLPEQLAHDLINKELPPIETLEYVYEPPEEKEGYVFI